MGRWKLFSIHFDVIAKVAYARIQVIHLCMCDTIKLDFIE